MNTFVKTAHSFHSLRGTFLIQTRKEVPVDLFVHIVSIPYAGHF